jgi:hypothetical protein
MVHAALLLLMLEAVTTDLVFTISLKRSTQILQLSTSWLADYPIYWGHSGHWSVLVVISPVQRWQLFADERGMGWNGLQNGWAASTSTIINRLPVPSVPF